MSDEVFREKVGEYSPKKLTRAAKDRKMGAVGYAEALLEIYNKYMKKPLGWQKLHRVANNYRPKQEDLGFTVEAETEAD